MQGAVFTSTFFDKFPSANDYGKKYQSGIKYRTICKHCNNVVLGEKDSSLKDFEVSIAEKLIEKRKKLPVFFEVDVPINRICKSICGHLLAAKESIDECVIDERLRQYVLSENTSAKDYGIRIFYWLYLYNTICIMRDVMPQRVIGGTFENELPTNVISFFSSFPFSFIVGVDELDVPGLYDLAEYTTNNIDEVVRVSISTESVYYKGTKEFRHFMWPCNIGDGKHDVHMVVGGEVAMKDSRLGIR